MHDSPQPNGEVARLWKALRDLREPANRRRAEATLFELLFPRLYTWVRKQGQEHHDAEDAAAFILSAVLGSAGKCRGLDNPDPSQGAMESFSWFLQVRKTRFIDWVRAKKRGAGVELDEESGSASGEAWLPPEEQAGEERALLARTADLARQAIRQIIQTRQPEAFYQQARKLGVGLSPVELDKQLHVYERVRWKGESTFEVGCSLGETGERMQLQNRVSKWVERGCKAFLVGCRYALTIVEAPDVRETLEKLEKKLAQPLKRRKV